MILNEILKRDRLTILYDYSSERFVDCNEMLDNFVEIIPLRCFTEELERERFSIVYSIIVDCDRHKLDVAGIFVFHLKLYYVIE